MCLRSTRPFTPRSQQIGAHERPVQTRAHKRAYTTLPWTQWSRSLSALVTFADFNMSPGVVRSSTKKCFYQQFRLLRLKHVTRRLIHAASAQSLFVKEGLSFSMRTGARPVEVDRQSLWLAGRSEVATMFTTALVATAHNNVNQFFLQ